ncbi:MAG: acyl-CoA dehydrogenase family protein [Chloroflexi bacterium]|nr:acyl-CoA dehydrogenase family protein [Chloroflexota bacterium]
MIDFELSEEQKRMQCLAKEFGEKELRPIAAEVDEKDQFSWEVWRKMAQPPYRLPHIYVPREYGGLGMGFLTAAVVVEEIGYYLPSYAAAMEQIGLNVLIAAGTDEQKRTVLPRIIDGAELGLTLALTEPGAGSDTSAIETTIEKDGGEFVINGRKRYASFGNLRNSIVVGKAPYLGPNAVNAVIVERDTPGFTVAEVIPCMGVRGHQDIELSLKNVRVPLKNLVGKEGEGLRAALGVMDNTRATVAAGYLGLARASLDAVILRGKNRIVFGRPLAENQAISFEAAEVASLIESARLLIWKACLLGDKGIEHRKETAMAKVMAADAVLKAANLAVRTYGGIGCSKRFPVERYYRDARTWTFAQATPEVLKLVIARGLFGLRLR